MENRCIIEQLGYRLPDEKVKIDSDDYLEAKINEKLIVSADKDLNNVVVSTINKTILEVDLSRQNENIIITVPILKEIGKGPGYGDYLDYSIIIDLNEKGWNEYFWPQEKKYEEKDLIFYKKKNEIEINEIEQIIMILLEEDKELNIEDTNIIINALKPLINNYLKNKNKKLNKTLQ